MTNQEIGQAILDTIEILYKKKYVGQMKIIQFDTGTQVKLGLNCEEKPIVISADLKDEAFLKFFTKELQSRHFDLANYFTGYKYETKDYEIER